VRLSAILVALAAAAVGCTRTTELFPSLTAACTAPGPVIHLGGDGDASCSGTLAATVGRFALCTCTDLVLTGNLEVGVLSGAGGSSGRPPPGPPPPPSFLTPVGSDGTIQVAGMTRTKGSVIAAGANDVIFGRGGFIGGNLHAAAGLAASSMADLLVAGDAYVGGAVGGRVDVQGSLQVPATATISPGTRTHGIVRQDVAVDSPCQCSAGPLFDVAAAITARKDKNANDTLSFPVSFLSNLGSHQVLELACGEYYLPQQLQTADGVSLELIVHGRVGIFVDGGVRFGGDFIVKPDEGAELDLVVRDDVFTTGQFFGSPATPSRTRLWTGGATVSLQNQIQFGATVYAPSAVFLAGVGVTFTGSLFAETLSVTGDVRLGYDPTVTAAGQSCGAAPPPAVE
jgi:hypothetical protein